MAFPNFTSTEAQPIGVSSYFTVSSAGAVVASALDVTDRFTVESWGTVLKAGHFYLTADTLGYIGMVGTVMHIGGGTPNTSVEFRVSGKTAFTISEVGPETSYLMRIMGQLDFGATHTGTMFLPQRASPVSQPSEGAIWYNSTLNKIQFASAADAMETVSSS